MKGPINKKEKGVFRLPTYNFTEGPIKKQILLFSGPILLSNLLQVSYQFIDSLWVGNLLGDQALGAVTISSTIVVVVLAFIIGINNATLTILSQQKGMQDETGLRRYVNAFVVLLALLSLLVGAFGFIFATDILVFLNTPDSMLEGAGAYLRISFLGVLLIMGYNFISTVLRALGDSKTPLKFIFIAVLLNTILDPLFIAGFNWGIHGAAIATVVSQGLAFFLALMYSLKKKLIPFSRPHWPSWAEAWLILKLGIPAGLQMMVIQAGVTTILSIVNSFGAAVVAGYGAAQRIDSLIMLPASALGTAVNSMAGQNIGANRWDRVRKIALYGVLFNFHIMFAIAILIFVFAEIMITWFIHEPDSVHFGIAFLKITAFFYPFLGLNFILNGIVRASGAMYQVLVLNILSFWVLRVPLTSLFSSLIGQNGIAYGIGISFVISSIFAFSYFQWGGWKRKRLFAKKTTE